MKKSYEFDVFFDIVDKGRCKVLVDNYGYICGIYRNFKEAKAAMKLIRRNIIREYKKRKELRLFIPSPVKISKG